MTENLLFIRALQAHLDRFEDLLGDDWPTFQQRLQALLEVLAQADNDLRIQKLVDDIIELGFDYPVISDLTRALLRQTLDGASVDVTRSLKVTDLTSGETRVVDARPEGQAQEPIVPEMVSQQVIAAGLELNRSMRASYANFTFIDVSLGGVEQELASHEGLVADHEYRLEVGVGLNPDQRFGDEQQPPIVRPYVSAETIDLYVSIFTRNSKIRILGDPLAVLRWPAYGASHENAVFVLEAAEVGGGAIDVYIYYKTNLLYTASFRAMVQPDGYEWDEAGRPMIWRYQSDEDKNRSLLFRRFARANQLTERGLNLVIQRGTEDSEYLITAFIGRAELPARVQLTRQELNAHIITMRTLLDRLRREGVYIEGGYDRKGSYTGAYTAESGGYTIQRQRMTNVSKVFNTFMRDMARAGSQFCDTLFRTDSGQTLRGALSENLRPGDIIQIWIDRDASDFVFPWAWLYDSALIDEDYGFKVQNDRFWGYRYIIEQMPQFIELKRFRQASPVIPSSEALRMRIGVYNFLQAGAQKEFFVACRRRSQGVLDEEIWDADKPWEEYLPRCDSQVLYFYTHGHTAKLTSQPEQQFYDMLTQWRAWLTQPLRDETPEIQAYRQRAARYVEELSSNTLLSQTFIKLTTGYLLLNDLRQMRLEQCAPLVFLNMCESAQVYPDISDSLIDAFLKRGARGVIGTEIPMLPQFADLFARRFFGAFFFGDGKGSERSTPSVGSILYQLRREFFDKGNPLGLAYTYFGDATVRLSHPLPDETSGLPAISQEGGLDDGS